MTRRGWLPAELLMRAQASGADTKTGLFPVKDDGGPVDVGQPLPLGMPVGMTHVVTGLGHFSADFALCHVSSFTLNTLRNESFAVRFTTP